MNILQAIRRWWIRRTLRHTVDGSSVRFWSRKHPLARWRLWREYD